jgi:lipid-A-disaccharide synthase
VSRILAVAGETSGDQLLAPLVRSLVHQGHTVIGLGGDAAVAAGLQPIVHARDVAGHGLVEAARVVPATLRAIRRLRAEPADLTVVVDCPEIGMRLLRSAPHPVAWLAPPQAWAWRAHRANPLRQAAWVGCLFRFSRDWYRRRGVRADWIGHPLATPPPPSPVTSEVVALLPGSRESAVEALLPVMLGALAQLGMQGVLPVASLVNRARVERMVRASGLPIQLVEDASEALAHARITLAGAGTATLQSALALRPCVVLARMHPVTMVVGRRLVRLPAVGLPNLVLGRRAFPECIQERCTPGIVATAAHRLLQTDWSATLRAVRRLCARPDGTEYVMARLTALLAGHRPKTLG